MSIVSQDLRNRAAVDRAAAEEEPLAKKKASLLASAAKLDELAEHAERVEVLSKGRS